MCDAAVRLINAGKRSEACSSMERVVDEVELAAGKESEALLEPLRVLASAHRAAGHLDDAYSVMMRAMMLSEKHHGEEGLVTCEMRTVMGEPVTLYSFPFLHQLSPLVASSMLPVCRPSSFL